VGIHTDQQWHMRLQVQRRNGDDSSAQRHCFVVAVVVETVEVRMKLGIDSVAT